MKQVQQNTPNQHTDKQETPPDLVLPVYSNKQG